MNNIKHRLLVVTAILISLMGVCVQAHEASTSKADAILSNPSFFATKYTTPYNTLCPHLTGKRSGCSSEEFNKFSEAMIGFTVFQAKPYIEDFCGKCAGLRRSTSLPIVETPIIDGRDVVTNTLCLPGFYSNTTTAGVCTQCPAGSVAPTQGSASCTWCSAGTYTDATHILCSRCLDGYYCPGKGQMTICPVGTASAYPFTECDACEGTDAIHPGTGQTVCTYASEGQYVVDNKTLALPCPLGNMCYNGEKHACPTGTYSDVLGSSNCKVCQVGSYQNVTGQAACVTAVPPLYAPSNGIIDPLLCLVGSFLLDNVCQPCPAGYYCPTGILSIKITADDEYSAAGASAPSKCPLGRKANAAHTACGTCSAGLYSTVTGGACTSCEAGFYCLGEEKKPVPAGHYQDLTGQSTYKACPAGTFAVAQSIKCNPCANETFPNSVQGACVSCPGGYECNNNGTNSFKTQCAVGTYAVAGSSVCAKAAAGFVVPTAGSMQQIACDSYTQYQDQIGQSACKNIPAGYSKVSNSVSKICDAGSYCPGDGKSYLCSSDTAYQPTAGKSMCVKVPKGAYKVSNTAAVTCEIGNKCVNGVKIPCVGNQYQSAAGSSVCMRCGFGSYVHNNTCTACPVGSMCPGDGTIVTCPAGYYAAAGSIACLYCALPNQYAPAGATSCSVATAGNMPTVDKGAQETCLIGHMCPNGIPVGCIAGSYAPAGATACTKCEAGKYTPNDLAGSCQTCLGGSYVTAASTMCSQCPIGYMCPGNGTSIVCPDGKFATVGQTKCTDCTGDNMYVPIGGAACLKARPGFTVNGNHSAEIPCPAGSRCPDGVAIPCTAGQFAYLGSTECTPCTFGYYQPEAGKGSCIKAVAPAYVDTIGASTYKNCTDGGKYVYLDACVTCPAGSFCPPNQGRRVEITSETQYSAPGASTPSDCPSGFKANELRDACRECLSGYYKASSSVCSICPKGSMCIGSERIPCPPNTYQPNEGSTTCLPCEENKYSPEGSSACAVCNNGQYYDKIASKCKQCPMGFSCVANADGSITKTLCVAGTYAAAGSSQCLTTEKGYYTPTKGLGSQLPCSGSNQYSDITGATSCKIIQPGYYKVDNTAQAICPVGYMCPGSGEKIACSDDSVYAPDEGQTSCTYVPAGTYRVSASSIDLCERGHGCNNGIKVACDADNQYQPSDGRSSCETILNGFYKISNVEMSICPKGFYCVKGVKSECENGLTSPAGSDKCYSVAETAEIEKGTSKWLWALLVPLIIALIVTVILGTLYFMKRRKLMGVNSQA